MNDEAQATKVIGLMLDGAGSASLPFLKRLEEVFPIRLERREPAELGSLDALLVLTRDPGSFQSTGGAGLPCLILPSQADEPAEKISRPVQFSESEMLPSIFRGRLLEQDELGRIVPLRVEEADSVLATIAGKPVWAARKAGGARVERAALSLPPEDETRFTFHYFEGFNFFRLLPLIDFIRRLTGEAGWVRPRLPACFMFDDPNLHGSGYGFIDYRKLAEHAATHRYHVSMATVPIDMWFTNPAAAAIFVKHKEQLSLLFHGSAHRDRELAAFRSSDDALQSLAGALRRVSTLERKHSLAVSKVMAPPHGACAEQTMDAMARLGFEGAALAYAPFCATNRDMKWSNGIGFRPCDVVASLPAMARFRFKYGTRFVLVAAYLNQPIIPYGHHEDVAGGLRVLEELAGFINSLGDVRWTNMGEVCRSNYLIRREGATLRVRSYARAMEIPIPESVNQMTLERPWTRSVAESLRVRVAGRPEQMVAIRPGEAFPVKAGGVLMAEFLHPQAIDAESVPRQPFDVWALARRQLCEGRDRIRPLFSRRRTGKSV